MTHGRAFFIVIVGTMVILLGTKSRHHHGSAHNPDKECLPWYYGFYRCYLACMFTVDQELWCTYEISLGTLSLVISNISQPNYSCPFSLWMSNIHSTSSTAPHPQHLVHSLNKTTAGSSSQPSYGSVEPPPPPWLTWKHSCLRRHSRFRNLPLRHTYM